MMSKKNQIEDRFSRHYNIIDRVNPLTFNLDQNFINQLIQGGNDLDLKIHNVSFYLAFQEITNMLVAVTIGVPQVTQIAMSIQQNNNGSLDKQGLKTKFIGFLSLNQILTAPKNTDINNYDIYQFVLQDKDAIYQLNPAFSYQILFQYYDTLNARWKDIIFNSVYDHKYNISFNIF